MTGFQEFQQPTHAYNPWIGAKPDHVYHDDCVFSEKRRVEMWHYDGGA